jgi:hypothetical protein
MENVMETFLERFYAKMRRIGIVVFVVSSLGLTAGGVILVLAGQDADEMLAAGVLVMAPFILPFLITGINLLRYRRIEAWPPYRVAVNEKESVVWVYFITTQIRASGLPVGKKQGIAFCNRDGKRFELGMSKKDREALAPLLADNFPRATIGWSRGSFEQYKSDPESLLRKE